MSELKISNAHGALHALYCQTCFARLHVKGEITLNTQQPTTLKLTPVEDPKNKTIHWEITES